MLAGSLPFSEIAARLVAGVDLRSIGTGTVSGTALYEVAGFGPLALAGSLDVLKGSVGPLLAGPHRPGLTALSTCLAITTHNWSPFLRGAGGRGISPALGATLVAAPEGALVLGAGLGIGRIFRQSALGTLIALVALPVVLARRRSERGLALGLSIDLPMILKRLAGNHPGDPAKKKKVLLNRLLFDRDPLEDQYWLKRAVASL
jgi:glycerol-3-phosphate acyltransferase PlsY